MNYDISTEEGMRNSVAWTQEIFSTIQEGGKWAIPRSGTIVTIDHSNKTAYILPGYAPEPDTAQVIKAMGWEVVYLNKGEKK